MTVFWPREIWKISKQVSVLSIVNQRNRGIEKSVVNYWLSEENVVIGQATCAYIVRENLKLNPLALALILLVFWTMLELFVWKKHTSLYDSIICKDGNCYKKIILMSKFINFIIDFLAKKARVIVFDQNFHVCEFITNWLKAKPCIQILYCFNITVIVKSSSLFTKASKPKKKRCMHCRETNCINAQVSFTEFTLARVLHHCSS